jgi:IclR family transcriptional regulator, KDG regulon repressor
MNSDQKAISISYSAPIVSKAMRVLKMILTEPENPGISEIASRLNLAKSTTHGILAALEETGWVLRDPITRKYTCGFTTKKIAENAVVRISLVELARPYLEKLSDCLEEDIFLGMCGGSHLLILDQVESAKDIKITARPGTHLSLYAGAAGKIFLAYHDPDDLKEILKKNPIPQFTPHSITDPHQYLLQLQEIREKGIAWDSEEYLLNVNCVAAPIFHGKKNRKRMVAGFWLVGLDLLVSPEKMERAKSMALETSETISRILSLK